MFAVLVSVLLYLNACVVWDVSCDVVWRVCFCLCVLMCVSFNVFERCVCQLSVGVVWRVAWFLLFVCVSSCDCVCCSWCIVWCCMVRYLLLSFFFFGGVCVRTCVRLVVLCLWVLFVSYCAMLCGIVVCLFVYLFLFA